MRKLNSLSIFFPFYNEETTLVDTVRKADKIAREICEKYEILMINDGSQDKTAEVGQQIEKELPNAKLISHPVNRGYGAAIKTGFYNAQYEWIAFTDGDGQFDFAEIANFIKTQQQTNADLVVGWYRHRAVSFVRKLNTFLWQFVVRLLFGLKVRDIDCGFKFLRREVIQKISPLESERGAFISTEFLVKAIKNDFKITEIPVTHYPRRAGRGTGANLNVIIRSFLDLFRLWRKLR